jgi:hypothetical protein
MLAAALCASLAALTTGAPAQSLAAAVLAARALRCLRNEAPSRRTTSMVLAAVALQGRHTAIWRAARAVPVDSMDRDHRVIRLSGMPITARSPRINVIPSTTAVMS